MRSLFWASLWRFPFTHRIVYSDNVLGMGRWQPIAVMALGSSYIILISIGLLMNVPFLIGLAVGALVLTLLVVSYTVLTDGVIGPFIRDSYATYSESRIRDIKAELGYPTFLNDKQEWARLALNPTRIALLIKAGYTPQQVAQGEVRNLSDTDLEVLAALKSTGEVKNIW